MLFSTHLQLPDCGNLPYKVDLVSLPRGIDGSEVLDQHEQQLLPGTCHPEPPDRALALSNLLLVGLERLVESGLSNQTKDAGQHVNLQPGKLVPGGAREGEVVHRNARCTGIAVGKGASKQIPKKQSVVLCASGGLFAPNENRKHDESQDGRHVG